MDGRLLITEARRRCRALVQLTTNKTRTDAIRFYDRLGFVSSHEGLKLQLSRLTIPFIDPVAARQSGSP